MRKVLIFGVAAVSLVAGAAADWVYEGKWGSRGSGDGRFVDPDDKTDDEVDLSIPITGEQLQAFLSGEESMAEAYIRGDLKPVGSTGLFLSLVELVESGALKSLA